MKENERFVLPLILVSDDSSVEVVIVAGVAVKGRPEE